MKRVLLHSCCGPCSTSVLESLVKEFEVAVFFFNPNIFPAEEYDKRLRSERLFCQEMKVKLIEGSYDHGAWLEDIKGFEDEPEGGKRCEICIRMRLDVAASRAKELRYDMFAATLTVSPHKSYELVKKLGREIEEKTGVTFLDRDFKKKDGFKRSLDLSKEHDLYRQTYCGCEFSK